MGVGRGDAATTAETANDMEDEITVEVSRIDWNVDGRDEEIALDEAFEARIESELGKAFPLVEGVYPFDVVYDRNGAFGASNRIHVYGVSAAAEAVAKGRLDELIKAAWQWTIENG